MIFKATFDSVWF